MFSNFENYYIIEDLEENEFLSKKKAIEKKTGKFVTLNIFKVNSDEDFSHKKRLLRYTDFICKIRYPSIVRLKKSGLKCSNGINIFFTITKFFRNDNVAVSIKNYLDTSGQNNEKMNPLIRSKIIFGVASAMKYLHKLCLIHRNLTLENIVLDDNFEPKIKDVSLFSTNINKTAFHESNYLYLAPELICEDYYTWSVDVYSFAFVIYKMFSNVVIFTDSNSNELSPAKYLNKIKNGERPIKPDLMPDCYWEIVTACFSVNSDDRLSFDEIVDFLKFDKFAIEEFGMKADIEELREYKHRILQYSV